MSITNQQYTTLDTAYKFFNEKLFQKKLPDCMIVLTRKAKKNYGYFHANRFIKRDEYEKAKNSKGKIKVNVEKTGVDEIALHPDNFIHQNDINILSTLVHEMCHQWRRRCTDKKKQPRGGYHDKVWGKKMEEIGLMPSNTGKEGGKKTGQQMDHYIIARGQFEKAALQFLKSKRIQYTSFPLSSAAHSDKKNKVKYTCPSCEQNAWAKPEASLICGECHKEMEAK